MSAGSPIPPIDGLARRIICSSLVAVLVNLISVEDTMAATPPSTPERLQSHCTGRFDYALPAALQSGGGKQSLYRLDVASEPWRPGIEAGDLWKERLAAVLTAKGVSTPAPGRTREFDLPGVGPAAWLALFADRPDLVTLLTMKSVAQSKESVFLRAEATTGREGVAEKVVGEVAAGAFVIRPSKNERALESFNAPGVDVSVETETVAAPDDGQSTDGDLPPGGRRLLKQRRSVGGFDGNEERVQVPDNAAGGLLVYTWIFAGRAADGAAPRVERTARIMAAAPHRRALNVGTIQITAEQMRLLGAAMRRQFEVDAIALLRRSHPLTMARHADDAMRLLVQHGIERARASRMDSVTDVQRWLSLMLQLGPYFDTSDEPRLAAIRAVLENVEVYGPLRVDEAEALAAEIAPRPT
jgi:hypothetical protein